MEYAITPTECLQRFYANVHFPGEPKELVPITDSGEEVPDEDDEPDE
jgi:hypothetical protein